MAPRSIHSIGVKNRGYLVVDEEGDVRTVIAVVKSVEHILLQIFKSHIQ